MGVKFMGIQAWMNKIYVHKWCFPQKNLNLVQNQCSGQSVGIFKIEMSKRG